MSVRHIRLRDAMQRSLRIDTISEAIPVMLVIGRLTAIALTIVAVKMLSLIKYRHYFDDLILLRRENITLKVVLGLFLFEMPLTTFPYNIIVAFVLRQIVKTYNALIDGTINALKALQELLEMRFEGLEDLERYKLSLIPVILAAYNAFLRFVFLVPILFYFDRKTSRGCSAVAKKMSEGVNAVIKKGYNVIMRNDLLQLARGRHNVLKLSYGSAVLTFFANAVVSIPAAVRTHKIIRRVNTTLRVCRGTVDSVASALVIVLRIFSAKSSGPASFPS